MINLKDVHPNWEALHNAQNAQLRMMITEKRQVAEARKLIEANEIAMADIRHALAAAQHATDRFGETA